MWQFSRRVVYKVTAIFKIFANMIMKKGISCLVSVCFQVMSDQVFAYMFPDIWLFFINYFCPLSNFLLILLLIYTIL